MRYLFVAIVFVSWTSAVFAERRVALVFGANSYETLRPLNNAVNDARAIEDVLEALDFEVYSEKNRSLKRMRRALEDFEEDAAGADVAFVFFAGHGVEIVGDNRLLPTDADASSLEALKETSLPLNEVQDVVARVARTALIVLDACRDDPFAAGSGGNGRGAFPMDVVETVKPGLGRMGSAENTLFAFSAAPGATASDGTGENSPFTTALTKYLSTEGLEIRSVLTLVQQEVYDRTRGQQLPYVESGLPQLFFANRTSRALPERERLLLAMAEIDDTARQDVERVASDSGVPLAPLYSALIGSDIASLNRAQRSAKLREAADAFTKVRDEIRTLRSGDVRVMDLRQRAEAELSIGAFQNARDLLTEAAGIDAGSRETLKANLIERTLSEAGSHYLNGGAAHAELRYDLAVADYERAIDLFRDVSRDELPADAWRQHLAALETLGWINATIGSLPAAARAFEGQLAAAQSARDQHGAAREFRLAQAEALSNLADVLFEQAKIETALSNYRASHDIRLDLAQEHPENDAYTSALAVSYGRLGRIYFRQGDLATSERYYLQKYLLGIDRVAALPNDRWWQRDLSVSNEKLGDIQRERGDLEGARAYYQASLDRMRPIRDANPDELELTRFISLTIDALGRVQLDQSNLDAALDWFEEARSLQTFLVATDPANTDWQYLLGLSHERIGDVLMRQGDEETATTSYEAKHRIVSALSASDPTNVRWLRDLSVADERLGNLARNRGDLDEAATHYQRSLDRMLPIWEASPLDMELNRFVSFAQSHLANVRMDQGREEEALALYRSGQRLREKLVAHDPQNSDWRFILGLSHERIGNAYLKMGLPAKAVIAYQEELAVMLPLAERAPDSVRWNRVVAITHELIGNAQLANGDGAAALASYQASLARMRVMGEKYPDDLFVLRFNGVTLRTIGETHLVMDDTLQAEAAFAQSLEVAKRLVAANPDNGWWQRDLFVAYTGVLNSGGRPQVDLEMVQVAASAMQELGTMIPEDEPALEAFRRRLEAGE